VEGFHSESSVKKKKKTKKTKKTWDFPKWVYSAAKMGTTGLVNAKEAVGGAAGFISSSSCPLCVWHTHFSQNASPTRGFPFFFLFSAACGAWKQQA
jgi:hypothetical protein